MSDPAPLSDAQLWLRYAREDLNAGRYLLDDPVGRPRHSAWLAEQAAEKALKALLIAYQRPFPYTHDLERLVGLLPEDEHPRYEDTDLGQLSTYAVDTRYPGMPTIDAKEAHAAIEAASQIVETVQLTLDQ